MQQKSTKEAQSLGTHVLIVGAGIAGLASAIALSRDGFKVTVLEQAEHIEEIGAGIQISSNASLVLDDWGLLEKTLTYGFLPQGIQISHWKKGTPIARFPLNENLSTDHTPYIHIHRADLHRILLNELKSLAPDAIHAQSKVISIDKDSDSERYQVSCANEATYIADWVIGADGIHSVVRSFTPAKIGETQFTGNVAWRGLIPISALPSNKPGPFAHLVMGPNGHMVFYYVKGGDSLNYVAIMEKDSWQQESWTLKGELSELLSDFNHWHHNWLNILKQSDPNECYRWALHDRAPLDQWHQDGIIILGDAAHPMLPFLAQGAAMGIEDAQALAHCFKTYSGAEIPQQFYQLRKERTARVQLEARKNMGIYHEANPVKCFVRDLGLNLISKTFPSFMDRRLSWLYSYRLKY